MHAGRFGCLWVWWLGGRVGLLMGLVVGGRVGLLVLVTLVVALVGLVAGGFDCWWV